VFHAVGKSNSSGVFIKCNRFRVLFARTQTFVMIDVYV
jgi:hypothetical protein